MIHNLRRVPVSLRLEQSACSAMTPEEYASAARRAVSNSEHETSVLMDVHNSGNLLLYLFLECVKCSLCCNAKIANTVLLPLLVWVFPSDVVPFPVGPRFLVLGPPTYWGLQGGEAGHSGK